MASQSPLSIGIVGGGIAGISAAIALKRAGHAVEVSAGKFSFKMKELLSVPNYSRFSRERISEEKQVSRWPSHPMLGKCMTIGAST